MSNKLSPTEIPSLKHDSIDSMSENDALKLMISSQKESVLAVEKKINDILNIVNAMHNKILENKNTRIIYVGAGTSGRIGVQDGAELYPTFGWPLKKLVFIIAGGKKALFSPVEDAEDNINEADRLVKINKIKKEDIVIGLAASGNTPFTCQFIKTSSALNALTIGISNNPHGIILNESKLNLCLDTGSEVIVGSTRLKAGTAQKVCLNVMSTLLMIKMKKVNNGEMSNMVITNKKLQKRHDRIKKSLINKQ